MPKLYTIFSHGKPFCTFYVGLPKQAFAAYMNGKVLKSAESSAALGEFAYAQLREAMRNGIFRPGDPVRERKVCEWLNISRTPVREAIRRLENEGQLTHKLHCGVVVSSIDRKGVTELYALREILEGAAAAAAARNATPAQIAGMQRILNSSARTKSVAEIASLNHQFHSAIHQAADNQHLLKTLGSVRESLVLVGKSTLVLPARPAQVESEHKAILDMISRGNAARAEKAMRSHIRLALKNRFLLQEQEGEGLLNFPDVPYPVPGNSVLRRKVSAGR